MGIGEQVSIGATAKVVCSATIGDEIVIGARALVIQAVAARGVRRECRPGRPHRDQSRSGCTSLPALVCRASSSSGTSGLPGRRRVPA